MFSGYSKSAKKTTDSKLVQFFVTNRVAVPLLALAAFTAYNYYTTGVKPVTFSLVTRQQFLGIIAGFLSNRVALLLTEIRGEVRLEDFLSIVPGSFAEVYRETRRIDEKRDQKIRENEAIRSANGQGEGQYDEYGDPLDQKVLSTVVVICGPQAAGRLSLTASLVKNGNCENKVRICKFLTTDRAVASYYPEKYRFVDEEGIKALRKENKIVYEGDEKSFFGSEIPVYLSIDDLTRRAEIAQVDVKSVAKVSEEEASKGVFGFLSKGKGKGGEIKAAPVVLPCVLDGPPEMLEALLK